MIIITIVTIVIIVNISNHQESSSLTPPSLSLTPEVVLGNYGKSVKLVFRGDKQFCFFFFRFVCGVSDWLLTWSTSPSSTSLAEDADVTLSFNLLSFPTLLTCPPLNLANLSVNFHNSLSSKTPFLFPSTDRRRWWQLVIHFLSLLSSYQCWQNCFQVPTVLKWRRHDLCPSALFNRLKCTCCYCQLIIQLDDTSSGKGHIVFLDLVVSWPLKV